MAALIDVKYLYIFIRIEYLYILFGLEYADIRHSISAYLDHTIGVYVHTFTYGGIQNNEYVFILFLRIKYTRRHF